MHEDEDEDEDALAAVDRVRINIRIWTSLNADCRNLPHFDITAHNSEMPARDMDSAGRLTHLLDLQAFEHRWVLVSVTSAIPLPVNITCGLSR
jgi:hypothetical protein